MARLVLLDTEAVLLQWDQSARAVIMTRTAAELPRDTEGLVEFFQSLVDAVAHVDRPSHEFVIDSRETMGRNDEAFERVKRDFEGRLFGGFRRVSVVLKSEVGRLQVNRYNDDHQNEPMRVFDTVEDALDGRR